MTLQVNVSSAVLALKRAKGQMETKANSALKRGALEIVREGKRNLKANGSQATSQLTQSLNIRKGRGLSWLAIAGTAYAYYVENGRRRGRIPPPTAILDWLRVKRIKPRGKGVSETDLAWLIARRIGNSGVKAKPFFKPAFDNFQRSNRLDVLLRNAGVGEP